MCDKQGEDIDWNFVTPLRRLPTMGKICLYLLHSRLTGLPVCPPARRRIPQPLGVGRMGGEDDFVEVTRLALIG